MGEEDKMEEGEDIYNGSLEAEDNYGKKSLE